MAVNSVFDSSQMRYQIMKGLEIQQLLEKENIQLRKENQNLKESIEDNHHMKSLFNQNNLQLFLEGYKKLKESFVTIKLELKSIHHDYSNYQKLTMKDYQHFKNQLIVLMKYNKKIEKQKLDKNNEIIKLQKVFDKTIINHKNDLTSKIQTIDKLTKDNMKWEFKCNGYQKQLLDLENAVNELKLAREELNKKNNDLMSKCELEKSETRSLRQQLVMTEMSLKVSDHTQDQHLVHLKDNHQKELLTLGQTITQLTQQLSSSQAELDRLSHMLVGNKSHFAKYVELKTENTVLMAKIKCYEDSSNALNLPAGTPRALIRSIRNPNSAGGSAGSSSGGGGGQSISIRNGAGAGSTSSNNNSIRMPSATMSSSSSSSSNTTNNNSNANSNSYSNNPNK